MRMLNRRPGRHTRHLCHHQRGPGRGGGLAALHQGQQGPGAHRHDAARGLGVVRVCQEGLYTPQTFRFVFRRKLKTESSFMCLYSIFIKYFDKTSI